MIVEKLFKHGINVVAYERWMGEGHLTTLRKHILSKYAMVTCPVHGVPFIEGDSRYNGIGAYGEFALNKAHIWMIDIRDRVVNNEAREELRDDILKKLCETDFENSGITFIIVADKVIGRHSYLPASVPRNLVKTITECGGRGYMSHTPESAHFVRVNVEGLI